MLAQNELEVSLREVLLAWCEYSRSVLFIELENICCTERPLLWWAWGCDHGCDETSSAGSDDQIKVVRQSSIWSVLSLDSNHANNPFAADPCQLPQKRLRNL
jgi:hypothetical protein